MRRSLASESRHLSHLPRVHALTRKVANAAPATAHIVMKRTMSAINVQLKTILTTAPRSPVTAVSAAPLTPRPRSNPNVVNAALRAIPNPNRFVLIYNPMIPLVMPHAALMRTIGREGARPSPVRRSRLGPWEKGEGNSSPYTSASATVFRPVPSPPTPRPGYNSFVPCPVDEDNPSGKGWLGSRPCSWLGSPGGQFVCSSEWRSGFKALFVHCIGS